MSKGIKPGISHDIINGLKAGDLNALEKVYVEYGEKILSYIRSYFIYDPYTAEDILHETFITIYKSITALKDKTKFLSWAYAIAANKCKNYIKKRNRTIVNTGLAEQKIDDSFQAQSEEKELFSIIHEAIEELPAKCKEVYILHEYHGMKYNKISNILKCSLRTVKYRMEKAMNFLLKYLKE